MMAPLTSQFVASHRGGEQRSRVPTRRPADKATALSSHRIASPAVGPPSGAQRSETAMASTEARPAMRMPTPSGLPQGPRSRVHSRSESRGETRSTSRTPPPPTRLREPAASRTTDHGRDAQRVRSPPNTLRRKPSTISAHAQSTRERRPSSSGVGQQAVRLYKAPPLPTQHREPSRSPAAERRDREHASFVMRNPEERRTASPHELRLPTPSFTVISSSPSTRHSESPGPWSRTSTPTSMSSHSPGLATPAKWAPRPRTTSPGRRRPPVTWRGAVAGMDEDDARRMEDHGLPSLRESLVSSSSGSTVKAAERRRPSPVEENRAKGATGSVENRLPDAPTREPQPRPSRRVPAPPRSSSARSAVKASEYRRGADIDARAAEHHPASPPSSTGGPSSDAPSLTSRKPSRVSPAREGPPPRPSREGAPTLAQLEDPSTIPVIQSNLTGLPFYSQKRRGSADTVSSGRTAPKNRRAAIHSPEPSADPSELAHHDGKRSPGLFRAQTYPDVARSLGPSPQPGQLPPADGKLRKRGLSPARTGAARGVSRFGLFTRRAAASSDSETAAPSKKEARKGPSAGTGHEGYGRYAVRGRSGSVTSASGSWVRSSSASTSGSVPSRKDSAASHGDHKVDEFFLDRLDPVVIVGGKGSAATQLATALPVKPGDDHDLLGRRTSVDSQLTCSTEFSAFSQPESDVARTGLEVSQELARGQINAQPSNGRIESGTNAEHAAAAVSRSVPLMTSRSFKSLPRINTDSAGLAKSHGRPSIHSSPVKKATDHIHEQFEQLPEGKEGHWLRSGSSKKRAMTPQQVVVDPSSPLSPTSMGFGEVRVQVAPHLSTRLLPHYAMLDSADQEDDDDLSEIMKEVAQLSDSQDRVDHEEPEPMENISSPMINDHPASVLLPDPPALPPGFQNPRPVSPKVTLRTAEPSSASPPKEDVLPSRPSRLLQVGRIPRVVSSRVRKPPLQSFSRPFSSIRPDMVSAPPSLPGQDAVELLPGAEARSQVQCDKSQAHLSSTARDSDGSMSQRSHRFPLRMAGYRKPLGSGEFLTFPTPRGSELSGSVSSGTTSFSANPRLLPPFEVAPGVDEVWKEYDDLIDEVFTPQTGYSLRSSYGFPAQPCNAAEATVTNAVATNATHDSPSIAIDASAEKNATPANAPLTTLAVPNISLAPPELDTPETPMSYTDIFAGYGERNSKSTDESAPVAASSPRRVTSPISMSRAREDDAQVSSSDQLVSPLTEFGTEEQDGLDSEMNLRFGALMTSRWLSFGRVLFSPVHDTINQSRGVGRQERLLVMDGLGNDDWSFYCALTYPHATVYNLSPFTSLHRLSPKKKQDDDAGGMWQSPANHRQIYQASFANPFPFPKAFFAAVVFRFPVAGSEPAYRNAISECKRVLRPGGYLEISVLDLDLTNMGSRARRVVRDLKTRMQAADSTVTLKPASDTILRLLGRRGFENVNRCTLGVPVAGNLVGSRETSIDEAAGADGSGGGGGGSGGGAPSLHELLRDRSEKSDQGITKMVARVGRWWYTRCYETSTLLAPHPQGHGHDPYPQGHAPQGHGHADLSHHSNSSGSGIGGGSGIGIGSGNSDGGNNNNNNSNGSSGNGSDNNDNNSGSDSIWKDRSLLRECVARQTSFKLLICYAQKPLAPRRRTVSV